MHFDNPDDDEPPFEIPERWAWLARLVYRLVVGFAVLGLTIQLALFVWAMAGVALLTAARCVALALGITADRGP